MIWVRATLPRIRYDRLMQFGWKVMLPLALVAVTWTAIAVVLRETGELIGVVGLVPSYSPFGLLPYYQRLANGHIERRAFPARPGVAGQAGPGP